MTYGILCKVCGKETNNDSGLCCKRCYDKWFYHNKLSKKECKVCRRVFEGKVFESCCSLECKVKSQKVHWNKCEICNKKFKGRSNQLYCSSSCYRLANKTHLQIKSVCLVCGEEFVTRKKLKDSFTCNSDCSKELIPTLIKKIVSNFEKESGNE